MMKTLFTMKVPFILKAK